MQSLEKRTLTMAICSYDTQMLQTLGDYLLDYGGVSRCEVYHRGEELLREIRQGLQVDALIIDEQMQDMDALTMLDRLRGAFGENQPLVVLLSAKALLRRLGKGLPAGVDLCIIKPFQASTLARRVHIFYNENNGTIHAYCSKLCEAFGVPGDTTNACYLADAVLLAWQADAKLAIRKEIILPVSEEHGVSLASVDSGLRRLVDSLESVMAPAYVDFKRETGLAGEKPTVGRLIYAIKRYAQAHAEGI